MSRQPERKLAARPRMNALGGDGALTALWVALHAAAAASPLVPVAMADDAAPPP
ncbi:hypothetical protein [Streptomyces sp. NPDC059783]|uniref:hypothetical protein n=1 Tax=Streptomyces sp. NPDC059783 TaxID=3346944 RepID=UPI0036654923